MVHSYPMRSLIPMDVQPQIIANVHCNACQSGSCNSAATPHENRVPYMCSCRERENLSRSMAHVPNALLMKIDAAPSSAISVPPSRIPPSRVCTRHKVAILPEALQVVGYGVHCSLISVHQRSKLTSRSTFGTSERASSVQVRAAREQSLYYDECSANLLMQRCRK